MSWDAKSYVRAWRLRPGSSHAWPEMKDTPPTMCCAGILQCPSTRPWRNRMLVRAPVHGSRCCFGLFPAMSSFPGRLRSARAEKPLPCKPGREPDVERNGVLDVCTPGSRRKRTASCHSAGSELFDGTRVAMMVKRVALLLVRKNGFWRADFLYYAQARQDLIKNVVPEPSRKRRTLDRSTTRATHSLPLCLAAGPFSTSLAFLLLIARYVCT